MADDYVTKPFNPLELMARVKSQLGRYKRFAKRTESPLHQNRLGHRVLPVLATDEIGAVAASVNWMAAELKIRSRSDQTTVSIVLSSLVQSQLAGRGSALRLPKALSTLMMDVSRRRASHPYGNESWRGGRIQKTITI